MDFLLNLTKGINNILWSYLLIFLLFGTGVFFTIKLRFVQVRKFGAAWKKIFGDFSFKGEKAGKEGMTSFQALATAIAAQVGTGNLAGAATAIVAGGPGAIFWMWISAFLGMATIFAEAVLAQKFKVVGEDGQVVGGPAYYISKGLGSKRLATFFSIAIILALGFMGNMVQSNSIADAFKSAYNVPTWIVGIFVAVFAGLIFMGGVKTIASFTEKIVPLMALIYVCCSLIVVIMNHSMLGAAFKSIFIGAFNPSAAAGGVVGYGVKEAIRYGVSRGLFSNEAGMGSTPHAHAIAKVKNPAEQGYMAIIGVFIDTFVILTLTALVILTSGVSGHNGIRLTQLAFVNSFGNFGYTIIAVCLFFFAFSTIIGWYYFGECNVRYLFGVKAVNIYKVLVIIFVFIGSTLKVDLVWELADTFNGLMVIPNLIALIALASLVSKTLKEQE